MCYNRIINKEESDMNVINKKSKNQSIGQLVIVDDTFEVRVDGYFTMVYRSIDSLANSGWEVL